MGRPKLPGTSYTRNREKRIARSKAYNALHRARISERQRKERATAEYKAVRKVKRKLIPSEQPEVRNAYRRARRAMGFNA